MNSDWLRLPIKEVSTRIERPERPLPGKVYRQLGVRLWGHGAYEREGIEGSQTKYATLSRVAADDIIVNKIWARNGSVAVVPPALEGCYVSGEFPTFQPAPDVLSPRWFHWLTKTRGFWEQCDEKSRGTSGKNRIRPEKFAEILIPVPSLSEQQRIVARIEELARKIEEAKRLRWTAVVEAEAVVISARTAEFSQLAKGLQRRRLGDVADSRLGKMLSQASKTGVGSTPYLRNANIQKDRLDLSSVFEMDFTNEERQVFQLRPGDVLVCEGGDIGKAAIWNGEIPLCCYQKALHRIRPNLEVLTSRFLLHHIFWAVEQGHFAEIRTQTTIAHLTGVKLKAYQVVTPSLNEQHRIVSHLDSLQAQVNSLRHLQAETSVELDAILPAVLDKAFKGEL